MKIMPSVIVEAIDAMFAHTREGTKNPYATLNHGHAQQLRAVSDLIRSVPDEMIRLPGRQLATLTRATSMIEAALSLWSSGNGHSHSTQDIDGKDPVTVIREILVACPDEYPSTVADEIAFVDDPQLRRSLAQDVAEANRALDNAYWKSATVMAGAAIEGLLHWRLKQDEVSAKAAAAEAVVTGRLTEKPPGAIDRWALGAFIAAAAQMGIITPLTVKAAELAQDFRNLIHPGRAARFAQECNRSTALSAVAALERVIQELAAEVGDEGRGGPGGRLREGPHSV